MHLTLDGVLPSLQPKRMRHTQSQWMRSDGSTTTTVRQPFSPRSWRDLLACKQLFKPHIEVDKKQQQVARTIQKFESNIEELHKSEINTRTELINELEKALITIKNNFASEKDQSVHRGTYIKELLAQNESQRAEIESLSEQLEELKKAREDDDYQKILMLSGQVKNLVFLKEQTEKRLHESEHEAKTLNALCKQLQVQLLAAQNETREVERKFQEAEQEREEAEREKSKNLSDSQSKIREILRLRKELKLAEDLSKNQEKQITELTEELTNFRDARPTREELMRELEKYESKSITFETQLVEIQKRQKFFVDQYEITNLKYKEEVQARAQDKIRIEELEQRLVQEREVRRGVQAQTDMGREKMQQLRQIILDLREKESVLGDAVSRIEKNERELAKSMKCNFCGKIMNEPITVIPCGHSFCMKCNHGYQNACSKCGPETKVEAMYRNELLDDILTMMQQMGEMRMQLVSLNIHKIIASSDQIIAR